MGSSESLEAFFYSKFVSHQTEFVNESPYKTSEQYEGIGIIYGSHESIKEYQESHMSGNASV